MHDNNQSNRSAILFYIGLSVCALAVAGAAILSGRPARKVPSVPEQLQVEQTESVQSVMAAQPILPTAALPPETEPEVFRTAWPLDGTAIADYAVECLAYNPTTRDWRTHKGTDLAAPADTPVCSAADGTVAQVYQDDLLGTTVAIRHQDGYVTWYSSLADVSIQPGDHVVLGQPIGTVGESASLESAIGSHLHFSVTAFGRDMDPNDFIALGES